MTSQREHGNAWHHPHALSPASRYRPPMKIQNLCSVDTDVSQRRCPFLKISLSRVVQKNVQKILAGFVLIKLELFRIREHDIIYATCVFCSTLDENIFDNSGIFLLLPGPWHHQRSNQNYRDTTRHRMYNLHKFGVYAFHRVRHRDRSGVSTHFRDVQFFRVAFARQRAPPRHWSPAKSKST